MAKNEPTGEYSAKQMYLVVTVGVYAGLCSLQHAEYPLPTGQTSHLHTQLVQGAYSTSHAIYTMADAKYTFSRY